jgi:hypothetical protein
MRRASPPEAVAVLGERRVPSRLGNYKHTTIPHYMPSSHRRYACWTIERIRRRDAVDLGAARRAC